MGWFDDVSSWFDDSEGDGSWLSRNSDWLKPVTGAVLSGINNSNSSGSRGDISSLLKQQVDRDYEEGRRAYDIYNQNQAAQAAASASRAAAAASNARARQQAQRKANSIQQKELQKLMSFYQPQKDVFDRLFPQMATTYSNATSGINSLLTALQTPEAMAKMNQSVSAHQTDVPLPSYLAKKKKESV